MKTLFSPIVLLIVLSAMLLTLIGCEKEPVTPIAVSATTHDLESRTGGDDDIQARPGYVEKACITDDKAGILCQAAASKGCKPSACEPLHDQLMDLISDDELANWPNVVIRDNDAIMEYLYETGYSIP